jgi:excisionase family DNA binding protein
VSEIKSDLMTPAEVAVLFRVTANTVNKWARTGKLNAIPTPGGRCRFRRSEVEARLNGGAK